MVAGVESRLQVPGGRLRMRVDGPAGAPWLVFSNALATDLTLWDPQVAAFALRYRMLRYDYRGHGASDPGRGEFGPDVLADDLLAVMQAAAVDRACHVGTSMGALAGLAAAARMPQRFDRLVLCGACLASSAVAAADLDKRAGIAQAQGMEALVEATLAKWFAASNPAPALRARVAAMIRATDAQSFGKARVAESIDHSQKHDSLARGMFLSRIMQFSISRRSGKPAALQCVAPSMTWTDAAFQVPGAQSTRYRPPSDTVISRPSAGRHR